MKPRVFIPERIAECGMSIVQESCECIAPWRDGKECTDAEQREILPGVDAVIVRLFTISAADLEQCPNLKVIGKHGVGVDNIDCEAATARGIPVVFTPTANSNAVAEHALALMLALARHIVPSSVALREGRFADRAQFTGVELAGKTLGVVGLGRIGSRVAEMASAGMDMKVRGYDPYHTADTYKGPAVLETSLDELFRAVDFLTLHVALSAETQHLINDERMRMLKPGCRLINTSRGPVVDERALVRALEEERIAGAAIDVFEEEPVPADHPLCAAPNLLLTPHISSSSRESMDRMARDSAQGVVDVLNGKSPANVANSDVMS